MNTLAQYAEKILNDVKERINKPRPLDEILTDYMMEYNELEYEMHNQICEEYKLPYKEKMEDLKKLINASTDSSFEDIELIYNHNKILRFN